ncbi:HAD family hydrolase [Lactiplantibacillus daowaiensis]|uniref:HAD family hydrolase n=1 Tax=Lactiplantibacillus daowaiensis TaxID=2559918 RepID=A0ABW1S0N1_9LACO|nr:HAD family phosphatase [Lactiplantibacillus daowaiensis]
MIKNLIFDFNGTMIFDSELQRQAWGQMLAQTFNHQMTEHDFQTEIAGRNNSYTFNHYADHPLTTAEAAAFSEKKEAIYREICGQRPDKFCLVAGLKQFLTQAQAAGIAMNIATASEKPNVDFFFDQLGLSQWFDRDQVVINDGALPGKPAPDMFLTALAHVNGLPTETAIFEDSPSGIQAANRAQVAQTILVVEPDAPDPILNATLTINHQINDYQTLFEQL